MFCNMGVGEDGDGKTQTLANVVSRSSWIFLWFLAMEAFRCGKVVHWIFSAALPNARHAVQFLTRKCYFNRHCTKKPESCLCFSRCTCLPASPVRLPPVLLLVFPSQQEQWGDGAFFPSLRSQHVAGNTWKKGSKPFPAPHCLRLLSKTRCLVSTPKRQHCLKPAEKTKSNTLLQATF